MYLHQLYMSTAAYSQTHAKQARRSLTLGMHERLGSFIPLHCLRAVEAEWSVGEVPCMEAWTAYVLCTSITQASRQQRPRWVDETAKRTHVRRTVAACVRACVGVRP